MGVAPSLGLAGQSGSYALLSLSPGNWDGTRDLFSMRAIVEVVSRFDVIAIQEVQVNIEALRMLVPALGPEWGLILTDATKGAAGDRERLAFIYDGRRTLPSGLACELVVPQEWLDAGVGPQALERQFSKTPYAVAFRTEGVTFILVTLHVIFGKKSADRLGELRTIACWMRECDEPQWLHRPAGGSMSPSAANADSSSGGNCVPMRRTGEGRLTTALCRMRAPRDRRPGRLVRTTRDRLRGRRPGSCFALAKREPTPR